MATVWKAPHDWTTSERVTAAKLNGVRDNLNYLREGANFSGFPYPANTDVRNTTAVSGNMAANQCLYYRVLGNGDINTLRFVVSVASGNVGLAVYNTSGSGVTAVPSARLATSGAIACPAAGNADTTLGATVTIETAHHWFALSANNATATFRRAGAIRGTMGNGRAYFQNTAHPPPDPATPSVGEIHFVTIMGKLV